MLWWGWYWSQAVFCLPVHPCLYTLCRQDIECLVPMGKYYKNIFMGLEVGQHSRKCSQGHRVEINRAGKMSLNKHISNTLHVSSGLFPVGLYFKCFSRNLACSFVCLLSLSLLFLPVFLTFLTNTSLSHGISADYCELCDVTHLQLAYNKRCELQCFLVHWATHPFAWLQCILRFSVTAWTCTYLLVSVRIKRLWSHIIGVRY